MSMILVTLGVSLAKKGILTASRTHKQIFLTISGFCQGQNNEITPSGKASQNKIRGIINVTPC